MGRRWRVGEAVAFLLAFAFAAEGRGVGQGMVTQESAERYAGHYQYVGGAQEVRALDSSINEVVSKMNFLVRGIARRKLREPNLPSNEIDIAVQDDAITIARPGRPVVAAPESGLPIHWRSPGGDTFLVSHGVATDGCLYQRFDGNESNSLNRFCLEPGGRLVVATTINARRLPVPLKFTTTYARR